MSILIYGQASEGSFKKSTFELVSYGKALANQLCLPVTVLTIGASNAEALFTYGAAKVLQVANESLSKFNAEKYAQVIVQASQKENATYILFDSTLNGKYLAPITAAKLNAGLASNVIGLPESTEPFVVKRNVFTNKAISKLELKTQIKVIGLSKNVFGTHENSVAGVVENINPELVEVSNEIKSIKIEQSSGKVTIDDAAIVVSGGRGLKGPENWGMIEDLAEVLGAATACSKPVSDMGWRPHSEHVGQTGKPVSSNLYIAVGISGAIQHLAGVNASKVKVVINNDPEAPFFKAADYGVVGDAFEVVPQFIEKLREFKKTS